MSLKIFVMTLSQTFLITIFVTEKVTHFMFEYFVKHKVVNEKFVTEKLKMRPIVIGKWVTLKIMINKSLSENLVVYGHFTGMSSADIVELTNDCYIY